MCQLDAANMNQGAQPRHRPGHGEFDSLSGGERRTPPVSTPSASDAEHTLCGALWVSGSWVALVSPPPD